MRDTRFSIRRADTAADYEGFGRVCRLYVDWCRARYADMPWFVEAVFGHQALDAELQQLAVKYGPPHGRVLIAEMDGRAVGGVAYRQWSDGVCELKRLYVADAARGRGLGRRLSQAMMAQAVTDGFQTMLLDSADRLTEAIALYAALGFEAAAPYQIYPERLRPHVVYMKRAL
jgi:GNAT superfamily N-acetyltransferase